MPIQRSGWTPEYFEFALKYAISSYDRPSSTWEQAVKSLHPTPIEIPIYQRSIVWRKQHVEDLIGSNSALFGTVILARYHDKPFTLIDGLQRFATATALLVKLYREVLSSSPTNPVAAPYFDRLKAVAAGRHPISSHNDSMLRSHPRIALRESYVALSNDIDEIITEKLSSTPADFAVKIQNILLDKQIAIDPYSDFNDSDELTNTFITMNSTGLDLSEVDLLRAKLVEKAIRRSWTPVQIQEMENKFTEIFENNQRKSDMKVLGKSIYEGIKRNAADIFVGWTNLMPENVDDLFEFINNTIAAADSNDYPYLTEIFECGSLPFAITMLYFYKLHMRGDEPDFLNGPNDTKQPTRLLLRAFYRRLIDGTIGQIGQQAEGIITGSISTVDRLASEINPGAFSGPLDTDPTPQWLTQRLRQSDSNRSKRVFNACMLPERSDNIGDFTPLSFGRKRTEYAIDHLIPKSHQIEASPGEHDIDLLPNFAPLTNELNSIAKSYPCERKIRPGEVYSRLTANHPFISWLVNTHYQNQESQGPITLRGSIVHPLDAQSLLEPNTRPPIGDERIQEIANILSTRL